VHIIFLWAFYVQEQPKEGLVFGHFVFHPSGACPIFPHSIRNRYKKVRFTRLMRTEESHSIEFSHAICKHFLRTNEIPNLVDK